MITIALIILALCVGVLIGLCAPQKQTYSVIVHHNGRDRTVASGLTIDGAIDNAESRLENLFNPIIVISAEK